MLRRRLLAWYRRHRRDLPWRAAPGAPSDPYRVWVSEVMLQQTRVQTVIPYYQQFLRRFPALPALAAASEAEVLAAWSGLGYYRRARQLHQAAALVATRHAGVVPMDWLSLRSLPGIGDYTASAILSIAAQQPWPAVDGNGLRIARRLTGRSLSPAEVHALWMAALPPRHPGDFNQAVMDLGATICLPRAPLCPTCPVRALCHTRGELPAAKPARKPRQLNLRYAFTHRHGRVRLVQRSASASQLAGMWELPAALAPLGLPLATFRHSITHHRIRATVHAATETPVSGRWFSIAQIARLPLTGLTRKILRQLL